MAPSPVKPILDPADVQPADRALVGGKGYALSVLSRQGFVIPDTVLITTDAYRQYVQQSGLQERIQLELHRKDFVDMRWEEVWDCTARIRNLFVKKTLAAAAAHELGGRIAAALWAESGGGSLLGTGRR